MREAVIISVARTPVGKAYRGAFNDIQAQELSSEAIRAAVARADIDPAEVDDLVMGNALQQGTTGGNIGRQAALRAGLPLSVPGMTIDRRCGSGLMAVATAAKQIICDGMQVAIGAGVESISLVQTDKMNTYRAQDPDLKANVPGLYMPMLETAEIVAQRYGISREAQDAFALESQRRCAKAQRDGRFDREIVPVTARQRLVDRQTEAVTFRSVTLTQDEGNRPETTLNDLRQLKPVMADRDGASVTAGNASQLSDGAAALVLMAASEAARRGLKPLGAYRGMAVAGCAPDEMGIGPIYAVPKLLKVHGLSVSDIGLWELNEAFASQALYCRDTLGIPEELMNVSGGAIAIGHPYGMSGARMVGHLLLEGHRRAARYGIVTMCIAGGMGAAGLFEIY